MTKDVTPEAQRTFAERLEHLRATVFPPGGKPYSFQQIADGMHDLGYQISVGYLWQLSKGEKPANPTLEHITGIAKFFGVQPSYFLDPDGDVQDNQRLAVIAAMRDQGVRSVALRAHGLTESDLAAITSMLDSLRSARGIPGDDERGSSS